MDENNAARDCTGCIRLDLKDLTKILDNIDTEYGRNDALRDYIFALRDLQFAHDVYATRGYDEIDGAQRVVDEAFRRLIDAQHQLSAEINDLLKENSDD